MKILKHAFSSARLRSVYGGTEPWVIGYQTREMTINEFGILDYQLLEVLAGVPHVTSLNPDSITPILRSRLRDSVEVLEHDGYGRIRQIRVRGGLEETVHFDGYKVNPDRAASALRKMRGVHDVQLVFWQRGGLLRSVEVRLHIAGGKKCIRVEDVLAVSLASDLQHDVLRDLLVLREGEPFIVDERSWKSPAYLIRELKKTNAVGLSSAASSHTGNSPYSGVPLKQLIVPPPIYIYDDQNPLAEIPGFNYERMRAFEFVSVLEERFEIEIDLLDDDLEFSLSTLRRASELVWRQRQSRLDQPVPQDA